MARKKDLGGLAALAGLAYMASRDKAASGDVPVEDRVGKAVAGDDQYNEDVKAGDMMSEKEPGWDSGKAAAVSARASTRPAAKAKPMGEDYGNESRRPVRVPYESKLTDLEKAKEDVRRGNAARASMSAAANQMEVGRLPKKGPGLSNFKSGGSVKGWGIARGARKAKTY